MDHNQLRRLAGIETLTEKKWSGEVKAKTHPAEGTFTKGAKAIVDELMKLHNNDAGKAMKALDFYINRAGADASNKTALEKAKASLHKKIQKEEVNLIRRRAGLPVLSLVEAEDEEMVDEKPDGEEKPEDKGEKKPKDKDEDDDLPKIVEKLALDACKKFGLGDPEGGPSSELTWLQDHLLKIYEAGLKDGAEGGKPKEKKEEKPKDEPVEESLSEAIYPAMNAFDDAVNKIDGAVRALKTGDGAEFIKRVDRSDIQHKIISTLNEARKDTVFLKGLAKKTKAGE